ncbi:MAG: VWA domain-containing protein, partial [Acidobacteriota bacterium]
TATVAAGQPAQQAPLPQFRGDVDQVLVDVTVVDADGRFVTGLTARDFRVYEEDRPMEISFFAFERFREAIPWAEEIPVSHEVSEAPVLPRHLVVFVDGLNTPPNDWEMVKYSLREYLQNDLQANDRVLLATLTPDRRLFVSPEFTSDTETLIAAADKIRTNPEIVSRTSSHEQTIFNILYTDPDTLVASVDVVPAGPQAQAARLRRGVNLAQAFAGERRQEVLFTLDAMTSLAAHLNRSFDVPGPKVMIMVSSGIAQNPGSNYFYMVSERVDQMSVSVRGEGGTEGIDPVAFRSNYAATVERYLLRTIGRLNRLNYVLYTIGARGLKGGLGTSLKNQVRSNLSPGIRETINRNAQDGLRMMAAGTGGLAFDNSSNFNAAFEQIDQDTSLRYVLGYRLPQRPDGQEESGKFRNIRVEVDVPGVRVRARRGYIE